MNKEEILNEIDRLEANLPALIQLGKSEQIEELSEKIDGLWDLYESEGVPELA